MSPRSISHSPVQLVCRVPPQTPGRCLIERNGGTRARTRSAWGNTAWRGRRADLRVEPGVVATELPTHITHPQTKKGVQQLYDKAEVIAGLIAFILSRPRRLAINEVLPRPTGQQ
jgi:hypothetical protein